MAGISGKYLGEIERGQRKATIDIIEKVAGALGVELSYLFDYGHEDSKAELEKTIRAMVKKADHDTLKVISRIVQILTD